MKGHHVDFLFYLFSGAFTKKRELAATSSQLLHTVHRVKLKIAVMYLAFAGNTVLLSHARLVFFPCENKVVVVIMVESGEISRTYFFLFNSFKIL